MTMAARAVLLAPAPGLTPHGGAVNEGRGKAARHTRAARYEAARRALDKNALGEYAAGIDYETPEFRELNHAVYEAEPGVPWWRRWLIDRRVLRELDYWKRMRGGR